MPVFTDRMKNLTDNLRLSIETRGAALGQVHEATQNLLGEARNFMADVSREHQAMADELHAELGEFHGELSDRVHEMRERHRSELEHARDEMHHRLAENQKARHEAVEEMRQRFQQARHEVAADLHMAGMTWREFVNRRENHAEPHVHAEPAGRDRVVVKAETHVRETKPHAPTKRPAARAAKPAPKRKPARAGRKGR